jgi:hypothetical protein
MSIVAAPKHHPQAHAPHVEHALHTTTFASYDRSAQPRNAPDGRCAYCPWERSEYESARAYEIAATALEE